MKRFIILIVALFFTLISGRDSSAQLTGGWFAQQTPTNLRLYDVKFFDVNTGIAVGLQGTILKTTNSGDNWNIIVSGTTRNLNSISLTNTSVLFVAGDSGTILKSPDYGNTWMLMQSETVNDLKSIAFISSDTGFCVGERGTLLKTINSGLIWMNTFADTSVDFSSISFINKNFIWVVGERDSIYNHPLLIKSTSMGSDWVRHSIDVYYATSVFFLDTLNGYVFKCGTLLNDGIQKTSNGGVNWECTWSDFMQPEKVFFTDENTGYAIAQGFSNYAIYKTTNSGVSWYHSFAPGNYLSLSSVFFVNSEIGWIVGNISTTSSPLYIMKTTNGGGTLTNIITTSNEVPMEFRLHQNYPNPFNPSTKIKFDVPKSSNIILSVYNSLGKKIEVLFDGDLYAGSYEVNFDGSNYASGVYYYKLESNGNSISKKMLLLK